MASMGLGLLFIVIFILFTGQQGAKRETGSDGRKPSLPPALRRHYFAARQNFQREPQGVDAYGGGNVPPTAPAASNEYGRQPPAASDTYAPSPSSSSASYQPTPASTYQSGAGSQSESAQSGGGQYQQSPSPSYAGPSSPSPSPSSSSSPSYQSALPQSGYQQQSAAAAVSSAQQAYQQPPPAPPPTYQSGPAQQLYQQQPAAPTQQQSYAEKPAPPTDYQTPAPPPSDGYEFALRRRKRAPQQQQLIIKEGRRVKPRCRRETLATIVRINTRTLLIHDIEKSPSAALSSSSPPSTPLSSLPIRAHGHRTQVQRVSPLDSLIGPEYSTNGQRSRNQNRQRERGQRGRPGTIPYPPAIEQTNEFAYVQQPRIPATGRGGRPLASRPTGPGGGLIGPNGQQPQQSSTSSSPLPPFFIGGRGRGRPPGVGIFVGNAKNGQFHHLPTSNSKNIPYANEAHRYYYPPRMPLPLPTCFHNPTGYPCCNPTLNDLMVETYTELESKPKFHTCNINAIAQHLQMNAENKFNTSFETVAAFDDFAQKIHFAGDLVCKVELGGKYMLAYATVRDAAAYLPPEESGGSADSGNGGNGAGGGIGQRQNGGAQLGGARKKRSGGAARTFVGPQLPLPLDDLSRRYSIWI